MSHATAQNRQVALGDLRDIPARMTIPVAGRLIAGLSRARSYELHRLGEFPAPVQQIGARFYVRGADVLRALGFDPETVLLGIRTSTNGARATTSASIELERGRPAQ